MWKPSVQLWWVVPSSILPKRGVDILPDSCGAPPGFVWRRHGRQQHQVPLQQQSNARGAWHGLGWVWLLEWGLHQWRNLRHRDQDGGIPVGPGWLLSQRRSALLLWQISAGVLKGFWPKDLKLLTEDFKVAKMFSVHLSTELLLFSGMQNFQFENPCTFLGTQTQTKFCIKDSIHLRGARLKPLLAWKNTKVYFTLAGKKCWWSSRHLAKYSIHW